LEAQVDGQYVESLVNRLSRNRRTLLGTALAAAAATTQLDEGVGKNKKKHHRCKSPTTRCGKKHCCQPDQACVDGQCQAPATTTSTPLTAAGCAGTSDDVLAPHRRYAQPFVADGTGKLAKVSFETNGIPPDAPLGVEIRSTQHGVPTNVVLDTAIVADIPTEHVGVAVPITATFPRPVAVTKGVTYALVITDLARKEVLINSVPVGGSCPLACYVSDSDTFTETTSRSMIFSISP
jgi:hypothetical protein